MSNPYLICTDRELRALPALWLRTEKWDKAGRILHDLEFIDATIKRLGVLELQQEYVSALRLLPRDEPCYSKLWIIYKVINRQVHNLQRWNEDLLPVFFLQQFRNESFQMDQDELQALADSELAKQELPHVRLRFRNRSDSPERIITFSGHSDYVNKIALNSTGRLAASISGPPDSYNHPEYWETRIKVWDVATGGMLHDLFGHANRVNDVAMSSDGRLVLSASSDHTLILWDVARGERLRTFQGHTDEVCDVALSTDALLAVSASDDHTLRVWDVSSGCELRKLLGHTNAVRSVALSANGQLAVSASTDGTMIVWDVRTSRKLHIIKGYGVDLAMSANGRIFVSVMHYRNPILSPGGTLEVWDVATGRKIRTLMGHGNLVTGVALSADGELVISSSWDKTLKIWNVASGRELNTFYGHTDGINGVAMSADGRLAVSASRDKTLLTWDLTALHSNSPYSTKRRSVTPSANGGLKSEPYTPPSHSAAVNRISINSDGRLAISISGDHTLKMWDVTTGRELQTLKVPDRAVAVSADGRLAILAGAFFFKAWNLMTGHVLRTIRPEALSNSIIINSERECLSADGRLAISASEDNTLRVWDVAVGQELRTLKGHTGRVNDVTLGVDGRLAVSASSDKTLRVWDVATGRELYTLEHLNSMMSVALSADGRLAISASEDNTLRVWDVAVGQELRTLKGHTGRVNGVTLGVDGRLAVSVSSDKTLMLWDVAAGRMIIKYAAEVPLICCALSPNGKTILAGDNLGKIHFLDVG